LALQVRYKYWYIILGTKCGENAVTGQVKTEQTYQNVKNVKKKCKNAQMYKVLKKRPKF